MFRLFSPWNQAGDAANRLSAVDVGNNHVVPEKSIEFISAIKYTCDSSAS
jgi:hypothetical protein